MASLPCIDMRKEMTAIKERYGPYYFREAGYIQDAAALWGANCNDYGVVPYVSEVIVKTPKCKGEIRFAETNKGYWLIGVSATTNTSGVYYTPSVCDTIGYESRLAARFAGVVRLISFFEREDVQKPEIQKVLSLLRDEKSPQLGLF